ncbi:MAG TPA: MoxR family ATPase [Chloroflexota bacterium]|nr:MoxR family ATPase [Chloroflexota bacterium]
MSVTRASEVLQGLLQNVETVVVGKRAEIELTIVALAGQGHLLIEDVPGVGKTVLAKSLAWSIGCAFKRIQFTPDLLPSDVTGVSIYNQKTSQFEFRPGPVVAQVVLADEINRATPKTQAALLEAMEEHQITVDGVTHALPRPFMVLATQNPIEYEGTFPLPESQLDRFMLRVHLGYPRRDEEMDIMDRQQRQHPIETLEAVTSAEELLEVQRAVREVFVDTLIRRYIVDLANATRAHPDVYVGASPRACLALYRASQAWALLRGREYVTPDDVKVLASAAFAHRMIVQPSARVKDVSGRTIVEEIAASVPVPGSRVPA